MKEVVKEGSREGSQVVKEGSREGSEVSGVLTIYGVFEGLLMLCSAQIPTLMRLYKNTGFVEWAANERTVTQSQTHYCIVLFTHSHRSGSYRNASILIPPENENEAAA